MSKYKDVLAMFLEPQQPRMRTKAKSNANQNEETGASLRNKRKAIDIISPSKMATDKSVKRSALGNVTNAVVNGMQSNHDEGAPKKAALRQRQQPSENIKLESKDIPKKVALEDATVYSKPVTRASARQKTTETTVTNNKKPPINNGSSIVAEQQRKYNVEGTVVNKPKEVPETTIKAPSRRISNEFDRTGDTLYMSALDIDEQSARLSLSAASPPAINGRLSLRKGPVIHESPDEDKYSNDNVDKTETDDIKEIKRIKSIFDRDPVPDNVVDFDKEHMHDCFQLSDYAHDIFSYLKSREQLYPVTNYIGNQKLISKFMRSLLVDWMVEVQESFELNHETLYLAVKLVDMYLGKWPLEKEQLQLLGAASLFIACKFDERIPPYIDDFLYICDGAYQRPELIEMERKVFKSVDYNLGIPLSYRFLRRYARVAKIPLPSLTLARYVLEYGLMEYETITRRDSKLAAAALYIALKMLRPMDYDVWSPTLIYYSGYNLVDFAKEVIILNEYLIKKHREKTLTTIRKKYSHSIFYEVALKTHLSTEMLFMGTCLDKAFTELK